VYQQQLGLYKKESHFDSDQGYQESAGIHLLVFAENFNLSVGKESWGSAQLHGLFGECYTG